MEENIPLTDEQKDFATPKAVLHDSKILWTKIKANLSDILSIRDGTDISGSIEGIKRDMVFRGHSAWILVASIFIASIGLNTNSTAVIIGAMLISPLMGPILAIGLAVGTNDWPILKRALKNFGIAIVISLFTSAFYFWLSPLSDTSSELLARTKPTILDVLIATFGGFAGIIAGSRYEKSNVIPGVAIATALMPPLCTAGYGLASGQFNYFLGAFYLFFLNSVFISLATFVMVRYFKFPVKHLMEKDSKKKFNKYMIIFVILVILPSTKLFWDVIQESRYNAQANNFVKEHVKFSGSEVINIKTTFSDTLSLIEVFIIGKEIDDYKIDSLNNLLPKYSLVADNSLWDKFFAITQKTEFKVHQARDNTSALANKLNDLSNTLSKELRTGILEELYEKNEQIIRTKDEKIFFLENKLLKYKSDSIPLKTISKELKIQYPELNKFAFAKSFEIENDTIIDTIPILMVEWKNGVSLAVQRDKSDKISKWLKLRLMLDSIRLINYQ
jgi:uncharacterized hydrophobic protein (TIGR00271 family)